MAVRSRHYALQGLTSALLFMATLVAFAAVDSLDVLERARALRVTDPQAALVLLEEHIPEIEVLSTNGDDTEELRATTRLLELRARIHRDIGQPGAAAADAVRLEQIAATLDEPVALARAQFMHGTIQAELGDIAGALERFHDARRTLASTDATAELARVINAIGVAHNFTHDYPRARDYYEQALSTVRRADDSELESAIVGNLALVISELEGTKAGLAAHREALALARMRDDLEGIATQLANICSRLVEAGRLDEADSICHEALDRVEALGNTRLIAGARMSVGDLQRSHGRLEEARRSYEIALAEADGRIPSVEIEVLGKLADVNEALGEPQRALDRLRQLAALREEALARERASLVEELEVRYRVEQQEREIELLELDRALQASKLKQRNLLLTGAGIALLLVTLLLLVAWRGFTVKSRLERKLTDRNRELSEALRTITRLAEEDSLTGLLNRRAFLELAEHETRRSRRTGEPLSLAMGDIDNFKALNDRYGHGVGDEVLRQIADRIGASTRVLDIVCRWGGEEFIFVLPGTHRSEAWKIIERVRDRISGEPIEVGNDSLDITMTFGVAEIDAEFENAIERADAAMYRGKNDGRNQIALDQV